MAEPREPIKARSFVIKEDGLLEKAFVVLGSVVLGSVVRGSVVWEC